MSTPKNPLCVMVVVVEGRGDVDDDDGIYDSGSNDGGDGSDHGGNHYSGSDHGDGEWWWPRQLWLWR